MRLTEHQAKRIVELAHAMAGESAQVRVFGSRLDDAARGGDLDLMLELPESAINPALLAARFSSRVTRLMQGRKVDVFACRTQAHALAHSRSGLQRRGNSVSALSAHGLMSVIDRRNWGP